MSFTKSIALASLAALGASVANAQPYEPFGQFGEWNVFKNAAVNGSCVAVRDYGGGTQHQVGIDPGLNQGYLALFGVEGMVLTKGQVAGLTFTLDGGKEFRGVAVGQEGNGMTGGWVWFDNPNFIEQLIDKDAMQVDIEDMASVTVDLSTADAAIAAVMECHNAS